MRILGVIVSCFLAGALWFTWPYQVGPLMLQAVQVASACMLGYVVVYGLINARLPRLATTGTDRSFVTAVVSISVAIIMWSIFSGLLTDTVLTAIRGAFRYIVGLAILWSVGVAVKLGWGKAILYAVFAGLLVTATMGIVTYWGLHASSDLWIGGRFRGFTQNPNILGMIVAALIPLIAAYWGKYKALSVCLLSAAFICLILAGSKTALVISVVAGSVTIMIVSRSALTRLLALLVLPVIGLGVQYGLQTLSPITYAILTGFFYDPTSATNFVARVDVWVESIRYFMDNPIVGAGGGEFPGFAGRSHAHNVVLHYAVTLGVGGLILCILFIVSVVWYVLEHIKQYMRENGRYSDISVGASVGIMVFIVANMMNGSFSGTTFPVMWMMLGILVAMRQGGGKKDSI